MASYIIVKNWKQPNVHQQEKGFIHTTNASPQCKEQFSNIHDIGYELQKHTA